MHNRDIAILFDMDGTLADTRPDLVASLNHALEPEGFRRFDVQEIGHAAGHGSLAMIDLACSLEARTVEEAWRLSVQKRFLEHYTENLAATTQLFPGVRECIEALAARGHPIGVCTNKPENLAHALALKLGLHASIAAIAGGDTFGFRKPDGRHVIETARLAGATHAIMVGDTITDRDAARNAGAPVILVDFGYSETPVAGLEPDFVISHYKDCVEAIDRILPGLSAIRPI